MITTEGKQHVRRYLANYVPNIAEAIAFGIGSASETSTDKSLQFEVGRVDVSLYDYDFVNDAIIFKGSVPDEFVGKVYEVAIYSQFDDATAGNYGSRIITTFDSATEDWSNPAYTNVNTRIGIDSLNHTPALSTTTTSVLANQAFDFSGYSGSDEFLFAFNCANTNTASIVFRFKTDASNHYAYTVTNPSSGYSIVAATKGSLTVTGTPNWATITSVEVATTSKAAGASNVELDGIRIEDRDAVNLDYTLVARNVVSPVTKLDGQSQDIEYALDVTL